MYVCGAARVGQTRKRKEDGAEGLKAEGCKAYHNTVTIP